jgi:glycosyltransferase involved in cell wall biosynthesis
MKPLVSVVIPVYNQERYIAEAVESVLGQTYPQVELVVVDDGSTDRTAGILAGYAPRLVYIRQDNSGAAIALNRGIEAAKGEYVGWLSSDDVYMPTKVERQVEHFAAHPDVRLTYTDFNVIDATGRINRIVRCPYYEDRKLFIRQLILGNFINGSSVIACKEALIETGLFDPEMTYHADANMWLRMLKHYEFGHVGDVLLNYRWHAANASFNVAAMKRHRYVYYQKIWESFRPDDLFNGAEDPQKAFQRFTGRALRANGLFDLALAEYRHHGAPPQDYARLAVDWARWSIHDTIMRTRYAVARRS